jgi:hypothetical protein
MYADSRAPQVDGVLDAATIADLKGRHMATEHFAALFDTAPPLAA